ncbi:MAG TPA: DUF4202 family protein, partial [Thermoanaerobaculia bacterium]|nr:DUF4202 family protein [Thermoanaerobaculia bacterium]
HAEASARAAAALLAATPVDPSTARRAAELIAAHDAPAAPAGRAAGLALLEEADALSFLVLNSHGYRRFHGDARWRDKVRWTLARLGPRGRARLAALRLAPDLAAALPALLVAPAVAPGLLPSSGGAAASLRRSRPEPPREET